MNLEQAREVEQRLRDPDRDYAESDADMKAAADTIAALIAEVEKAGKVDVCRYPECKCPTESPCLKGLPVGKVEVEPVKPAGPEDQAVYDAIANNYAKGQK